MKHSRDGLSARFRFEGPGGSFKFNASGTAPSPLPEVDPRQGGQRQRPRPPSHAQTPQAQKGPTLRSVTADRGHAP
eukprot:8406540-Pyramimonas_sp.AAC.2